MACFHGQAVGDCLACDIDDAMREVDPAVHATSLVQKAAALVEENQRLRAWEDVDDEWTDAIRAAHPTRAGTFDQYATAMRMVGHRHSKGELVSLVTWLLARVPPAIVRFEAALTGSAFRGFSRDGEVTIKGLVEELAGAKAVHDALTEYMRSNGARPRRVRVTVEEVE